MSRTKLLPLFALSTACATTNGVRQGPPKALTVPVSDTFHGVTVTESYRWLEDWSDPKVKAWSDGQNRFARDYLAELPHRDALQRRVGEIMKESSSSYWGISFVGDAIFAMEHRPPQQQPFIIMMSSVDGAKDARVVVDPNEIDPTGKTHIDWYQVSPKGDLLAVSLSVGGTESGDVHLFDVATGKATGEVIPRVNGGTAGGDLAWAPDGSGFFYTRYPRGEERPAEDMNFFQQLYWHTLGQPTAEDRYELGKALPRIAEIQLAIDAKGRLLVTVQKGDGGEFAHYLRKTDGTYQQFSKFGDKTLQATFGPNEDLYLISRKEAPRGKVLRVPLAELDVAAAKVIIPEGKETIVSDFWGPPTVRATASRLYVLYQLGGPSEIRTFDLEGQPTAGPKVPPVSAVYGMTPAGGDDLLFRTTSFVSAPAWMLHDAKTGQTRRTSLFSATEVDFSGVEVVREMATSKDGTQVPVNILLPKGLQRDGTHPCVVYGYGGFNVALTPRFRKETQILLSQGVIYAVANLRGGSEFGEAWHRQGNLTQKQNVFDDFAAVIQHMIDRKYTSSARLATMGGSNGGLLMGATMTQHPQLMKAVVSSVGIYDMLRVELSSNGAFNIPEYGTVKDQTQFEAMYAYSPYHRVVDGTAYPATLFLTGENDPRVDPMQSRKMTARLQAAQSGDAPILLRTTSDAGHGGGTHLDERIAQVVDVYGFLFHHLKVTYR